MKVRAVFFDRDGTIVVDVPYNGDPEKVEPMPGAREALDRLRAAGLPLGVISNQSGIGRGLVSAEQVDAVNRRVDALLGPFSAGFFLCPHAPSDDCACRKPKPQLLLDAARSLGVDVASVAYVGDKASDEQAARSAGAIPVRLDARRSLEDAARTVLSMR